MSIPSYVSPIVLHCDLVNYVQQLLDCPLPREKLLWLNILSTTENKIISLNHLDNCNTMWTIKTDRAPAHETQASLLTKAHIMVKTNTFWKGMERSVSTVPG